MPGHELKRRMMQPMSRNRTVTCFASIAVFCALASLIIGAVLTVNRGQIQWIAFLPSFIVVLGASNLLRRFRAHRNQIPPR